MVDMASYWMTAHVVTKIFVSASGLSTLEAQQIRPNGPAAITMKEYDQGLSVLDTWYIKNDPNLGVVEYQDAAANGKITSLSASYLIPWGSHNMVVGEVISQQIKAGSVWGWQTTKLAAILASMTVPAGSYDDVAQIDWTQSWCANAACSTQNIFSGTYYMAAGIGQIRMDWPAGSHVMSSITETAN